MSPIQVDIRSVTICYVWLCIMRGMYVNFLEGASLSQKLKSESYIARPVSGCYLNQADIMWQ